MPKEPFLSDDEKSFASQISLKKSRPFRHRTRKTSLRSRIEQYNKKFKDGQEKLDDPVELKELGQEEKPEESEVAEKFQTEPLKNLTTSPSTINDQFETASATTNATSFENSPSIEPSLQEPTSSSYETLTSSICETDEVYLFSLGGQRAIIPRRKIGSWINVSRFKILLTNPDQKLLDEILLIHRKKFFLENQKLQPTYNGYWVPIYFAINLAKKFKIDQHLSPLLEFHRVAKTAYCGFDFYEMFVHITENRSIRILRRCDNNYMNINQFFAIWEALNKSVKKIHLQHWVNDYIKSGKILYQSNDSTLCGGNWIPLNEIRNFCNEKNLTDRVVSIVGFDASPHELAPKPLNKIELTLINNWKIIDFNKISLDYNFNTIQRYHGFPIEFELNPNINKRNFENFKKIIEEESKGLKTYEKLLNSIENVANFKNKKFEFIKVVSKLIDAKTSYLGRLGQPLYIRLRQSKRNMYQDYFVYRRYSDGKVNLTSLLSTIVALRLNKLSRSDQDPDMQIDNELYFRDQFISTSSSEIYINFTNYFYTVFNNNPVFKDSEIKSSSQFQSLVNKRDNALNMLNSCVNGKWGDIKEARNLVEEFKFNSEDNPQHSRLSDILESKMFDDRAGHIAWDKDDFVDEYYDGNSDIELLEVRNKDKTAFDSDEYIVEYYGTSNLKDRFGYDPLNANEEDDIDDSDELMPVPPEDHNGEKEEDKEEEKIFDVLDLIAHPELCDYDYEKFPVKKEYLEPTIPHKVAPVFAANDSNEVELEDSDSEVTEPIVEKHENGTLPISENTIPIIDLSSKEDSDSDSSSVVVLDSPEVTNGKEYAPKFNTFLSLDRDLDFEPVFITLSESSSSDGDVLEASIISETEDASTKSGDNMSSPLPVDNINSPKISVIPAKEKFSANLSNSQTEFPRFNSYQNWLENRYRKTSPSYESVPPPKKIKLTIDRLDDDEENYEHEEDNNEKEIGFSYANDSYKKGFEDYNVNYEKIEKIFNSGKEDENDYEDNKEDKDDKFNDENNNIVLNINQNNEDENVTDNSEYEEDNSNDNDNFMK